MLTASCSFVLVSYLLFLVPAWYVVFPIRWLMYLLFFHVSCFLFFFKIFFLFSVQFQFVFLASVFFFCIQPPRRRKTLWDFLLDEMRLVATDYHEERKMARHLMRGVAQRAKRARRELCEVSTSPNHYYERRQISNLHGYLF